MEIPRRTGGGGYDRRPMTDTPRRPLDELTVDTANLYREDTYTDLAVATLRRLTPVTAEGADDPSRPVQFIAETQLMSQMGPVPVSARIEAATLAEAIQAFPAAIKAAVERMMDEAREMQRREASRIVTAGPGAIPPTPGDSSPRLIV